MAVHELEVVRTVGSLADTLYGVLQAIHTGVSIVHHLRAGERVSTPQLAAWARQKDTLVDDRENMPTISLVVVIV